MNWLNIEVSTIRKPEYVGADPIHRATWLNLMAYCAEQENGGIVAGCLEWKCRRWQQTCGVTKAEVEDACELWRFEGGNLAVWNYPLEKEIEVAAKRDGGRKGGLAKAENEAAKLAAKELESIPPSSASGNATGSASTERKGKERKGRESKGKIRLTLEEIIEFVKSIGLPESDGIATFHKWEGNGWTNGGRPIKDCKATIRSWKAANYMPSQDNPKNGKKGNTSDQFSLS
jgi:hypothetical protein